MGSMRNLIPFSHNQYKSSLNFCYWRIIFPTQPCTRAFVFKLLTSPLSKSIHRGLFHLFKLHKRSKLENRRWFLPTLLSWYHKMELGATWRTSRFSSYEKLVAIGLGLLAVLSPLYIDRRTTDDSELDSEEPISFASWLPLLLLVLILAIALSLFLDRSFSRFDPYWIHRVGGSSSGITIILMVLALVLKFKSSIRNWDA